MSASQTPPTGRTPNGATPPPAFFRRRKPADPLVRKKPNRPPPKPAATSAPRANGTSNPNIANRIQHTPLQGAVIAQNEASQTSAPDEPYVDIPIVTTKKELLKDMRHHVMRLLPNSSSSIAHVDPSDESQFTRPVRLHRRDPRYNPSGNWQDGDDEPNGIDENAKAIDEAERAKFTEARLQRQAQREAIQAETAPVDKPVQQKKKNHFQKKTEQVFQVGDAARNSKNMKLRYEEAIPWHLEDFDNKNIWSGVYEASLSERHVMLLQDQNEKKYRIVPLEKWYKFSAKNQFKYLSIEEAEARMSKKLRDPRWFMDTQRAAQEQFKQEFERQPTARLLTRRGERGERPGKTAEDDDRPEALPDANDIDYDYEEAFADDEENPLFGGDDDENKEAEEKIKRERFEANVFELKEEKDYEQEEEQEKKKQEEERKKAKKTKKALLKKEKNYIYESDSEKNPYSSSSESEDSETERLKEEERRKEEEQKAAQDKAKLSDREKPSGASSKGTNTPTGRPKPIDPLRKKLKRPGSPNLSEASGNESSRKKIKKRHPSSQPLDDRGSRAPSISRPSSPSNVPSSSAPPLPRKSSIIRLPVDKSKLNDIASTTPRPSAGSGSDGETSDGTRSGFKKRRKIGSGNASPNSGSPNGSRAASPARQPGSPKNDPEAPIVPFTPDEIRNVIPEEGITLKEVLRRFKGRTNDPSFTAALKQVATMDKETKLLKPKKTPAPGSTNTAGPVNAAASTGTGSAAASPQSS